MFNGDSLSVFNSYINLVMKLSEKSMFNPFQFFQVGIENIAMFNKGKINLGLSDKKRV